MEFENSMCSLNWHVLHVFLSLVVWWSLLSSQSLRVYLTWHVLIGPLGQGLIYKVNHEIMREKKNMRNETQFGMISQDFSFFITDYKKKKTHFSSVGASWSRSNHNWCNWGRSARGWATRTRDWRKNLMNRDRPRTSHLHPSSSLPVRIRRLLRYALLAWKSSKKQKKEIEVLIAKGYGTCP